MTDITASGPLTRRIDVTSDVARARVRKRYRAEARFRWLGIGALVITTIFLVVLITDIVTKGLPAFWQNYLVLDVPVAADKVDPQGNKAEESLRGADYMGLARNALVTAVPGFESRTGRKQLSEILSSGAANDLRTEVVSDPSLIGTTLKTRLLLSDDADLHLKGQITPVTTGAATNGIATPTGTTGEVKILAAANDFAPLLSAIKTDVLAAAQGIDAEAARLELGGNPALAERIADLRGQAKGLRDRYAQPGVTETLDTRMPSRLISINGGLVKITKISASEATGTTLLPLKDTADAAPGTWQVVSYDRPESNRAASDQTIAILEKLKSEGKIESSFNTLFFTAGDSREPEQAGIRGAIVGSALTLLITLGLCVPIGVLAAIYLEEFAPKNRVTDFVEININNLAAVPSIVFGLLGLAVFLNFFGMPRSAPLVGGLVLALLVLPTIIIAARAALKSVPPSIREAALGVGASKQQAIFHHVLPLAMPGIMTGTIIGMAHALGETAPLLLIGMVAFIVDVPGSVTDAATVLPVQIFLWSDLPEAAFRAKTAAAIMVLLVFLFAMNGLAIWLRKKFERRW
jgi:phosphate transport system permease protein